MSEIFRDYTQHLTRGNRTVRCGEVIVLAQPDRQDIFQRKGMLNVS